MSVIRFLFALLLGFVVGAGTMLWLVQSGAGDFMIRRTEVVQDMERKVRDLEQQRDSLTRTLEDVASRTERMEKLFNDLEAKYRAQAAEQAPPPRQAPREAPPEPGAEPGRMARHLWSRRACSRKGRIDGLRGAPGRRRFRHPRHAACSALRQCATARHAGHRARLGGCVRGGRSIPQRISVRG